MLIVSNYAKYYTSTSYKGLLTFHQGRLWNLFACWVVCDSHPPVADFYLRHFVLTRSHAMTQISFPSWVKFYCFDFAFFISLAVFLDMDPVINRL